ncbi:hypothetical protein BDY21DRAFT_405163, partial [Lineolata rhizophorae]
VSCSPLDQTREGTGLTARLLALGHVSSCELQRARQPGRLAAMRRRAHLEKEQHGPICARRSQSGAALGHRARRGRSLSLAAGAHRVSQGCARQVLRWPRVRHPETLLLSSGRRRRDEARRCARGREKGLGVRVHDGESAGPLAVRGHRQVGEGFWAPGAGVERHCGRPPVTARPRRAACPHHHAPVPGGPARTFDAGAPVQQSEKQRASQGGKELGPGR